MDRGILHVYCLDGSTAKKFQLDVPRGPRFNVEKLRTYLLAERRIPMECQTLFLRDQNGMFEHLQADDRGLNDLEHGKTLHLYVKKSSQTAALENTRQSDFDVWYKKFKELKVNANYKAHPAPASRQRPGAGQPQPAARQSSGGLLDITASMPLNQAPPPPPQARPTHRPQTRPLLGQRAPSTEQRGNVHKHNTQSEHCLKCYHDKEDFQPSTYYCYHCPPQMCVFCDVCVIVVHENTPGHDIELIDRGDVPPALLPSVTRDEGVYKDGEHHYSIIRDDLPYDLQYEQPVAANNPVYVMQAQLAEDCQWKCDACTMLNLPHRPKCSMCETDRPVNFVIPDWYVPTDEEKRFVEAAVALQPSGKLRWKCVLCTFDNLPHRPSCEQCSTERPADFEIPADYEPEPGEMAFVMGDAASRMQLEQNEL